VTLCHFGHGSPHGNPIRDGVAQELIHRVRFHALPGQIAVLCIALQQSLSFQVTPDTPRDAIGQLGDLNAGRRLHPTEPDRSVGTLDIHAVEEQKHRSTKILKGRHHS